MLAAVRPIVRSVVITYRHRGLRQSDVLVAAFPKSGSTWLRFALAAALTGREMDFDLVRDVSPPLGEHRGGPAIAPEGGRLVKSHELPRFVGSRRNRPKVVLLVRDGRDVGISYFHHLRRRAAIPDDFASYWENYVTGTAGVFGSWQDYVRSWLDYSQAGNVLTVRYEDLLADPDAGLTRISERFGLQLTPAAIEAALRTSTPDAMRAKESSSQLIEARTSSANRATSFVRQAKAGGWREDLDPALAARFEAAAGRELVELGYPPHLDIA
jgi:Sulfotransferase domain